MSTRVVNIRDAEFDVYIGRAGHGLGGYFGNPFSDGSRAENIGRFYTYFHYRLTTDPAFKEAVEALRSKRLGCFCAPKACHGDIIAQYLDRVVTT